MRSAGHTAFPAPPDAAASGGSGAMAAMKRVFRLFPWCGDFGLAGRAWRNRIPDPRPTCCHVVLRNTLNFRGIFLNVCVTPPPTGISPVKRIDASPGDAKASGPRAPESWETGFGQYVRGLFITVRAEDCGGIATQETKALHDARKNKATAAGPRWLWLVDACCRDGRYGCLTSLNPFMPQMALCTLLLSLVFTKRSTTSSVPLATMVVL